MNYHLAVSGNPASGINTANKSRRICEAGTRGREHRDALGLIKLRPLNTDFV